MSSSSSTPRDPLASSTADVVVVGAGIAGLAVAANLARVGAALLVLEADDRPGGKIAAGTIAGQALDAGTDAWLARGGALERVVELAGLSDDVIRPASLGVWLWDGKRMVRMPGGTVLGIPSDPWALREWLGPVATARAAAEPYLPADPIEGDVSVGEFVSRRFGRSVATELVDPLLGGVYAGHVDQLSLRSTIPPVAEIAAVGGSVIHALRAREHAGGDGVPFRSLAGGLHRLPAALAERLGDALRLRATVAGLVRDPARWRVRLSDGEELHASAVVLAVPASVTAELLRPIDAEAAALAGKIPWASVGVVLLAYPSEVATMLPEGSGMLVPRSAGRFVKAATWVSAKWGRDVGAEPLLLRASVGRIDDDRFLAMTDEEVIDRVTTDLAEALGLPGPLESSVVRWQHALPQYVVGHGERVAAVRERLAEVAPGLVVAGASWDGVGISPIAAAAEQHVATILEHLAR